MPTWRIRADQPGSLAGDRPEPPWVGIRRRHRCWTWPAPPATALTEAKPLPR